MMLSNIDSITSYTPAAGTNKIYSTNEVMTLTEDDVKEVLLYYNLWEKGMG